MIITVVGQGYVGLPLAIAASEAGFKVFGLDKNDEKISLLNSGKSYIEDLNDSKIQKCLDSQLYVPTTNQKIISKSNLVLICVPTPLSDSRKPDISALESAIVSVARNIKKGALIIVESTIEPGTCRNILLPILLKESGLKLGDFEFAYSPERIDPANKTWGIRNTPKLVAGLTVDTTKRAGEFYGKFINSIVECASLEIAETAKLLENAFRFVNISFINELAIFCRKINIDISEVISAAATKPYGFMPFFPSIGVGGHCIPVDPIYLANAAKAVGAQSRFIELADQVNHELPSHFVARAEEILGAISNKTVLVIGVSYKPNVADIRETPVEALILALKEKGAEVFWHDDLVKEWNGEKSVALNGKYDLAILATPHDYLDLSKIGDIPFINTQGSV